MDFALFSLVLYAIGIAFAVFQVVVIIKLYHVCNYILSIRDDKVTVDKLKYLKATKNPTFEENLNSFIFNYLTTSNEYYNYEHKYKHIIDVCKKNGFEIPEAFVDLDTEEKFDKVFTSL